MAIDFQRATINFVPTEGREQNESATVAFSRTVIKAEAALNGFDIQFTDEDHHFLREAIDASIIAINGNTVTVNVKYVLRDSSGDIDDRYQGSVDVLVIAEVQ
jgi:hypothetical protein